MPSGAIARPITPMSSSPASRSGTWSLVATAFARALESIRNGVLSACRVVTPALSKARLATMTMSALPFETAVTASGSCGAPSNCGVIVMLGSTCFTSVDEVLHEGRAGGVFLVVGREGERHGLRRTPVRSRRRSR